VEQVPYVKRIEPYRARKVSGWVVRYADERGRGQARRFDTQRSAERFAKQLERQG
jgi:hypothetical protein